MRARVRGFVFWSGRKSVQLQRTTKANPAARPFIKAALARGGHSLPIIQAERKDDDDVVCSFAAAGISASERQKARAALAAISLHTTSSHHSQKHQHKTTTVKVDFPLLLPAIQT